VRYVERDHERAVRRSDAWASRRPDAELSTLRQRRHRLIEQTRPRSPAPVGTDPLTIAVEALTHLNRVRNALGSTAVVDDLREAEEAIRRLAWGPD
jgi:hypothetical protein